MQKRIIQIIAWLLLAALLLGFVAMAVAAETADNGSYLFGITRVRSLQEQVELADAHYFDAYKNSLSSLYQTYKKVMTGWALPNLKAFLSGQ